MLESQSILKFNNYVIDEIKFKVNKSFESESIPLKIDFKKKYYMENEKHYINIVVTIFDDTNNSPFNIFVSMTGEFEFQEGDSEIDRQILLDTNAVAIMFPYLRSVITNITSSANIPPLVLPVINVRKLI